MKVVVVGSGIGGVSAAYHLLQDDHEVILCEKNAKIGGHACTVSLDNEDVDLGFMMFGDSNPNIKAWFTKLGLTKKDGTTSIRIPMSMSVTSEVIGDVQFSSRHPFASVWDLFDTRVWQILIDIYKFTVDLMTMPDKTNITTREWAASNSYSHVFFRHYFLPFVAILWTIPKKDVLDLPASQFLRCLKTHSNSLYIPLWQVIMGIFGRRADRPKHLWWYIGAKYHTPFVQEMERKGGSILCNAQVVAVSKGGKSVTLASGEVITCDAVVLAGHGEESAKLIPWSPSVPKLLEYRFHNSTMYVHRDPSFLPECKKAWSSWNVRITQDDEYIMTYWINRIQRLKTEKDVFVTITPLDYTGRTPKKDTIIMEFPWDHPRLLADCLPQDDICDEPGIVLSGAWLGRGFHEDGYVAGRRAALMISQPKHRKTPLYEDPENIPVPDVPPFGPPVSFTVMAALGVAALGCAVYFTVNAVAH